MSNLESKKRYILHEAIVDNIVITKTRLLCGVVTTID